MRIYRNYEFIIEQYINKYLEKKMKENYEVEYYCPDFEVGMGDNGELVVLRHDKDLIDDLNEIVDFLNSEFESSLEFSKFQ